jgi:hypothetical protein
VSAYSYKCACQGCSWPHQGSDQVPDLFVSFYLNPSLQNGHCCCWLWCPLSSDQSGGEESLHGKQACCSLKRLVTARKKFMKYWTHSCNSQAGADELAVRSGWVYNGAHASNVPLSVGQAGTNWDTGPSMQSLTFLCVWVHVLCMCVLCVCVCVMCVLQVCMWAQVHSYMYILNWCDLIKKLAKASWTVINVFHSHSRPTLRKLAAPPWYGVSIWSWTTNGQTTRAIHTCNQTAQILSFVHARHKKTSAFFLIYYEHTIAIAKMLTLLQGMSSNGELTETSVPCKWASAHTVIVGGASKIEGEDAGISQQINPA